MLLLMIISHPFLLAQESPQECAGTDPFLAYIKFMHRQTAGQYDAMYRKKTLFDPDTSVTKARVRFLKDGGNVRYLHIEDTDAGEALLYDRDTVWYRMPGKNELMMLGIGLESMAGNRMQDFLPLSLIVADTLFLHIEPFWRVTGKQGSLQKVSFSIGNLPPEIERMIYELEIDTAENQLRRVTEIALFDSDRGSQFQELVLSAFSIPGDTLTCPPDAFVTVPRVIPERFLPGFHAAAQEPAPATPSFLSSPELHDLSGAPYLLPQDGIILMDLWYAGCFPCMKSAPVLELLYEEYKDRIYFLSINEIDKDPEKILRFKEAMQLTLPVLLNTGKKISGSTGASGYPLFLLVDATTLQILWQHAGYNDDLEALLREAFELNLD